MQMCRENRLACKGLSITLQFHKEIKKLLRWCLSPRLVKDKAEVRPVPSRSCPITSSVDRCMWVVSGAGQTGLRPAPGWHSLGQLRTYVVGLKLMSRPVYSLMIGLHFCAASDTWLSSHQLVPTSTAIFVQTPPQRMYW